MLFGLFTLFVALVISCVAAYYSIVGLTAIFSAAVLPIVIMGASLEVGKVTAAVWLKLNWDRAKLSYKLYLVPAVAFLMLLTSMGIFGFLSKAHSDQSLVSGDVVSKIAIYDEKIKTEKENIETNRRALKQMDEGVDQVLGRSTDEKGADKAVALRRAQQKERSRLQAEISQSQKSIQELNEARAPIAAEVRKVEAEVGPIKYIAALIYGDNPDSSVLERSVRWVIIIIVAVFDPLALVLILSAQQSIRWAKEEQEKEQTEAATEETVAVDEFVEQAAAEVFEEINTLEEDNQLVKEANALIDSIEAEPVETVLDVPVAEVTQEQQEKHNDPAPVGWMYSTAAPIEQSELEEMPPVEEVVAETSEKTITPDAVKRIHTSDYIEVDGKKMHADIFALEHPELAAQLGLKADNVVEKDTVTSFGSLFPNQANKGDMFLRVDYTPNKLFKFNGSKWIEVDKELTDSYTYDKQYINFLIEKLTSGEYELDQLSATEQELVAEELKRQEDNGTA